MNTNRPKFCCMIAGNKMNIRLGQLYSERVRAIRWFEKNQPDKFDLYGKGWDEPYLPAALKQYVFPSLFEKFYPIPSSYRGELETKRTTLENYKFSICYENLRDCPGYITEKIFDSFFAGCIPVYLGANNVTDYIPDSTFIDKRYFKDYERLYSYMAQIGEGEHRRYLKAIQEFIRSEQIQPFGTDRFVNQVLTEMTAGMKKE